MGRHAGLLDLHADELLQLSGRIHLADDVAASDELPVDVELGGRRPIGERLDPLQDIGGTKYINRFVAWLCDFCADMTRMGMLPHCVTACPNGVFMFGDLNEDSVSNGPETFRFSDLVKDKAGYRLMEDLGTKPSVYYLPPVNRNFKFEDGLPKEEPTDKKS